MSSFAPWDECSSLSCVITYSLPRYRACSARLETFIKYVRFRKDAAHVDAAFRHTFTNKAHRLPILPLRAVRYFDSGLMIGLGEDNSATPVVTRCGMLDKRMLFESDWRPCPRALVRRRTICAFSNVGCPGRGLLLALILISTRRRQNLACAERHVVGVGVSMDFRPVGERDRWSQTRGSHRASWSLRLGRSRRHTALPLAL